MPADGESSHAVGAYRAQYDGKRCERTTLSIGEVIALYDPIQQEGQRMPDSERVSAADGERASGEGSGVSAKRRSRRRWSAEEKARIVGESFWPGTRVEDVARRYGLSRKQLSAWRTPRTPGQVRGAVIGGAGTRAGRRRIRSGTGLRHARGGQREGPRFDGVGLDRGARSDGAPRRRYRCFEDRGDRLGATGASMIVAGTGMRVVVATHPVDFRKGHDGLAAVV